MTAAWSKTKAKLRFRVGEKTLFSRQLSLLQHEAHFTELSTDLDAARPPKGADLSGLDGFLVRSHPVAERLPTIQRTPEGIRYVPRQYRRFFTRLEGTFEEYLAHFSSKTRSTLRRKVKKFADRSGGTISWAQYASRPEMEEFYGHARAVSARTYQERLLDAGLPEGQDFTEAMLKDAERGHVRGWILFHDQKPVAYLYCPVVLEGILLYAYLGYDPEYSQASPGTVLQYLVFESLFADGSFSMFDFTEGEGDHKEFFGTDHVPCADIYWLFPTLKNRTMIRLHQFVDGTSSLAGRLLETVGLKRRIKRFLRAGKSRPEAKG